MTHRNIKAYQRALVLVQDIRKSTQRVGLDHPTLDQIIRSSLSITANIAEGAGRQGAKERAHFYNIARASVVETYSHFEVIAPERKVDPQKLSRWMLELEELSKMLFGLMRRQMECLPNRNADKPMG